MPSLPKTTLHFLTELLKHQAKKQFGDGALTVLSEALTGYAGDSADEKLTAFIGDGRNAGKILSAFQQADLCFSHLGVPDYAQITASTPLAALENLENLAARFTPHLDARSLRNGIRAQLQKDWGDRFTSDFYARAAEDYRLCLERTLAAATGDLLPSIFAKTVRIEAGVREILDRLPAPQQAADYRDAYLDFLIDINGDLQLPDGRSVPLERVYVSLRADRMNAAERQAEHEAYLQDLETLLAQAPPDSADPYTRQNLMNRALLLHPRMTMLNGRDWERAFGRREKPPSRNLGEVVAEHPAVVLLGDPGSGKTTLGRWLTLQHARALREGFVTLRVPLDRVQPGVDEPERQIDLGAPRLPLFIRIAQYAAARWPQGAPAEGNALTLEDFLARGRLDHRELPHDLPAEMVGALALQSLVEGRALVILDGMDEVTDLDQRRAVMETIHTFIQRWQPRKNRILLTSRILGYQFAPLTDLPHYTVEAMDETAIRAFCHAWMGHFHPEAEAKGRGDTLAEAIFKHDHPGVRSLAGNPLLLTLLAQVYRASGDRALPHRRVDLFAEVLATLYKHREHLWDAQGITELRLARALSAAALYLFEHEPSGMTDRGTLRYCLGSVLRQPEQVDSVLRVADEGAGFLVSLGEKIYAFLHRALQEYFAARALADLPPEGGDPPLLQSLREHGLDPAWREPLTLALGILQRSDYPLPPDLRRDLRRRTWETLLTLPDPAAAVLPRRALLAAAAFPECAEDIPPQAVQQTVLQLLAAYRTDSPDVLKKALQRAVRALQNSPAALAAVAALADAVQDEDFPTRWAALDLLIETAWYHAPDLLHATLAAWKRYAAPSGAMMVALYTFHEKRPEWFTATDLPFRRAVEAEPALWQQAVEDEAWHAALTALYLAPWQDFTPDNIWRDSPLTSQVLAALQANDLESLRRSAWSTDLNAGMPPARDAALLRAALGDESLAGHLASADAARPGAGGIGFLGALDLARDLDLDLYHARALNLNLALDLASALNLALDLDLVFDRVFDRDRDRALARTRDLDHALARTRDLVFARDRDRDLARGFVFARARARARTRTRTRDRGFLDQIQGTILRARQHWDGDIEIMESLAAAENRLQALQETWESLYLDALARLGARFPAEEAAEARRFDLAAAPPADLVAALRAPDDAQRRAARQALEDPPPASALGKKRLIALAALAAQHEADPRVGTPLNWMLAKVIHDRPDWVRSWMAAAAQAEDARAKHRRSAPAERLLNNLYSPDEAATQALWEALPHASKGVNLALLHALRWGSGWHPDVIASAAQHPPTPLERLAAWLARESAPDLRAALLDLLGHWRADPSGAAEVLLPLLSSPDRGKAGVGAARLAAWDEDLRPQVRARLEAALPGSAPALARLLAAESGDADSLLATLRPYLPKPQALLPVLLEAGTDDDAWDDDYHGLLAATAAAHLQAHSDLLPALLARLREALAGGGDDWPARRMALAAVAACVEVMPARVQSAAGRPQALEALLVQGQSDANSFSVRLFALSALSYLRAVTPAVAPVLLAALEENITIVQEDAAQAVARFQRIQGQPEAVLAALRPHLRGPSAARAYSVAKLLSALGASPAGEPARLRPAIIQALAEALQDPFSAQEVVVAETSQFSETRWESKGPLKETLYEELLRVAGWV